MVLILVIRPLRTCLMEKFGSLFWGGNFADGTGAYP